MGADDVEEAGAALVGEVVEVEGLVGDEGGADEGVAGEEAGVLGFYNGETGVALVADEAPAVGVPPQVEQLTLGQLFADDGCGGYEAFLRWKFTPPNRWFAREEVGVVGVEEEAGQYVECGGVGLALCLVVAPEAFQRGGADGLVG